MAKLGSAGLYHLPMVATYREKLMKRDYDHAIGKGTTNGIDHLKAKADEVMKMDDVGFQVTQHAEEVAFNLFRVPIGNEKVVIFVSMIEEFAFRLPKAHQGSPAVPRDRVADASEEAGFDIGYPVEALVQIVGCNLGPPERKARVAVRHDENAWRMIGHSSTTSYC